VAKAMRNAACRRAAGDERKNLWERAAEVLLIEHGAWLRRDDFRAVAVRVDGRGEATIRWDRAQQLIWWVWPLPWR